MSVMEEGGGGERAGGNVVGRRVRTVTHLFLLQTMIVLEYMPKGDLRNYLLSRQPQ